MRKKDKYDTQAEVLLGLLIELEQTDPQTAFDVLAAALRNVSHDVWDAGMGVGYKAGKEPLWIRPSNPHVEPPKL